MVPVAEFLTSGNLSTMRMSVAYSFVGLHAYTSSRARHYMETHERAINKMQRPDIMEAIRVALHKILSRLHSKTKMRPTNVKRVSEKKNKRESRPIVIDLRFIGFFSVSSPISPTFYYSRN